MLSRAVSLCTAKAETMPSHLRTRGHVEGEGGIGTRGIVSSSPQPMRLPGAAALPWR